MKRKSMIALFAVAVILAGCGDDSPRFDDRGKSVEGTPEADIEVGGPTFNILSLLRGTSNSVRVVAKVSRPSFESAKGNSILVNDGIEIELYEFDSKEDLDKTVAKIAPDGMAVGGDTVTWPGPPHFYRTDRVLIIYFGSDADNRKQLDAVFGPQVAGAR